ncbi:hypothetical protein GCM10007874_40220 [Labrys miyagiensis]|uniref:Secreted protein n=1 Tax=Labrys miyagiensis TaxID=346912 RepID=A0ABQ6CLF6_9HYPH|nr:hypothetical protein GCM10007874_40220 [Labrys miyagiensis]
MRLIFILFVVPGADAGISARSARSHPSLPFGAQPRQDLFEAKRPPLQIDGPIYRRCGDRGMPARPGRWPIAPWPRRPLTSRLGEPS